jgi:hypothetical protein
MAVELEIRDGSPWWVSPDIMVVADPNDTDESAPAEGRPCYLKARVRNNGSTEVSDAIVKFYWANPAVGVTRNTANLIGQAFVSLAPGDVEEALCLTRWVPEYFNNGHACVLAEAFHEDNDPIATTFPDFEVPTDRHVAQRNLGVIHTGISSTFHFNFEAHNAGRNEQTFQIQAEQVPFEKIIKNFPVLAQTYKLNERKEGKLKRSAFTTTNCFDPDFKERKQKQETLTLQGYGKDKLALTGEIEGDFVLVYITQHRGKIISGGICVLIINSK